MKVTTKTQKVMEGEKVVRELHYLTFENEQGQTYTMNVGKATVDQINKMNEPTTTKNAKK